MKRRKLWRTIAGCHLLNCIAAALLSVFSTAGWAISAMIAFVLTQLIVYRRSTMIGEGAAKTADMLERLAQNEPERIHELEGGFVRSAWSKACAVRSALGCAGALYAINALYVVLVLLKLDQNAFFRALAFFVRFDALPMYAMFAPWIEIAGPLNAAHAAILLIAPFICPLAGYLGYLQGRQNWLRTRLKMQESLAKGPRKIVKNVKKCKNPPQTPEI